MKHKGDWGIYLQVSPLEMKELGATDVMSDERVFVLPQAELLQPGGNFLRAPPLNYTSQEQEAPFQSPTPSDAWQKQIRSAHIKQNHQRRGRKEWQGRSCSSRQRGLRVSVESLHSDKLLQEVEHAGKTQQTSTTHSEEMQEIHYKGKRHCGSGEV